MEYKASIIGRKREQEILQKCIDSENAEFVAIYGRRRVGKTYLGSWKPGVSKSVFDWNF